MTYADYKELTFERRENGVLLITLNRPEKYNAADEGMHHAAWRGAGNGTRRFIAGSPGQNVRTGDVCHDASNA